MTDTAHYPLGVSIPDEVYYPVHDESIPLDKRGAAFIRWVSAFWTPMPEFTDDAQVLAGRAIVYDETGDKKYQPTTDILSAKEVEDITYPDVFLRSGRAVFTTNNRVWWDNAQHALCDIDGKFSHVKALLIWCDMSPAGCLVGTKNLVDRVKEASAEGKATRELTVLKMEGANHFVSCLISCRSVLTALLDPLA